MIFYCSFYPIRDILTHEVNNMIKKILISILSLIVIMIIIAGCIRHFVNVRGEYLLPPDGIITQSDRDAALTRQPEYIFPLESSASSYGSAVIGAFKDKKGIYCSIFDNNGKETAYAELGTDSESFELCDIRCGAGEIDMLCINDGSCVLYALETYGASSKVNIKAEIPESLYTAYMPEISGIFLPDSEMRFILFAGHTSAVLYDTETQEEKMQCQYTHKSIISSALYIDDMLVICGAASDDIESNNFSFGFAEAFDNEGKILWNRELLNKKDCVSAAMECQITPQRSIMIYGRFFDYSESDIILSYLAPEKYEELKLYGHGADYYIYSGVSPVNTGENVPSSAFITEIDFNGEEKSTDVYSALNDYVVPSILHEKSLNKLDKDGKFILAVSRAFDETSDTYHITIDGTSAEIPSDIKIMYTVDTKGGIYVYMAESSANVYIMKHFASAADFAEAMSSLRRAERFSKAIYKLPQAMLWFVILSGSLIAITAKNRWRKVGI